METTQGKNNNYSINFSAKNNLNKLSKIDSNIQDLDYEEAIIYDKRSFLKIYWGLWKHVDRKILRETPIERVSLLYGFVSLCGCGNVDVLERQSFISHINRAHYGIVSTSTCLNQPPWNQLVHFVSQMEESDVNLT